MDFENEFLYAIFDDINISYYGRIYDTNGKDDGTC